MESIPFFRQAPSEALDLSQRTDALLRNSTSIGGYRIPIPFLSSAESTDVWNGCEKLLLSCLRTSDDRGAFMCLERLIQRFGASHEKVMGLRGLYQEAVAEDENVLSKILREYDKILAENPANAPVAKRRVALFRNLTRPNEAIHALTELLKSTPTDIEAWAELAELYFSHGAFSQATFCFEEILLVAPNAWNVHARLGEILYIKGTTGANDISTLSESLRRFCRSLELCEGFTRGYYGLKLTSDRLISLTQNSLAEAEALDDAVDSPPSVAVLRQLNEKATSRIADAVRQGSEAVSSSAEIAAIRAQLNKETLAKAR